MSNNIRLILAIAIFALWTNVGGLKANRFKNGRNQNGQIQNGQYPNQHTLGNYSSAAITIDGKPCAKIGL